MNRKNNHKIILILAALLLLVIMGFAAHTRTIFMMDDEWYSTNLATGEPLTSFSDIIESQIWHFFNWGGRCVTHGVLQLTLMCGELGADILNLGMTLLLTYLICVLIQQKNLPVFLLAHSMIYALNANPKMSMFWQAGTANYVYSSVWILLFMLPFIRLMQNSAQKALPLAALWLLPIGLMAGWSNENMGPVCFLLALGTALYQKLQKRPIPVWIFSGIISSFAGSILVIAAPGNFVRSAEVEKQTLYDRFYSMLTAGTDFLLPCAVLVAALLLIKGICLRLKISLVQWTLLAMAVLSFGAMVLSPHYPDRATFGTMILCIALSLSLLSDIESENTAAKKGTNALTICFFLCAIWKITTVILHL